MPTEQPSSTNDDSRIILLDDHLISKIAAGEVIERPASVVKELIENAIDAGATEITVEIKDAGKSYIRITDNGGGMTGKEAEMSIIRHATSKLSTDKDLESIATMGFRGEALASMVSVSRFTLTTKKRDSSTATELKIEGNSPKTIRETSAPDGTTITVEDLFFNTPARKKYLKSNLVEQSKIIDTTTSYALIYPGIRFTLISDKKPLFTSPKTSDLISNIATIYGKDTAIEMLPLSHEAGGIKITGAVSKPGLTRASKKSQSIYVNRRYIKNSLITGAVYDAYHTLLPVGRHPVFMVAIELDPSTIDVNVHPAKTEIRIEKENELYEIVFDAVKSALKSDLIPRAPASDTFQQKIAPSVTRPSYTPALHKPTYPMIRDRQLAMGNIRQDIRPSYSSPYAPRLAPVQTELKTETRTTETYSKLPPFTIKGCVFDTYIIAESGNSTYLIDQHAAEERVNYERLKKSSESKTIETQSLVAAKIITLSLKDSGILKGSLEAFRAAGFDIEPYSDTSFSVRSVPVILGRMEDEKLISDLIDDIFEESRKTEYTDIKESIIKMTACKASVKAGEKITTTKMLDILKRLDACENPYTCPHGRPTMIEMTKTDLEKRFKRV